MFNIVALDLIFTFWHQVAMNALVCDGGTR